MSLPSRVARWRPDTWTQVVLVLIALQTAWRGWAAFDAYFWQDDFSYLADVRRHGLTPDVLFQSYNGHVMPGSFVSAWLVAAAGSSHILAAALTTVLSVAAAVLLAAAVRMLFGTHPATLVVLAAALFSPLCVVGYTWFAYGLQLWPQQISLLGCLCSYLAWRQSGRWLWCAVGTAALVFGLFFWEKALLAVPAVALFALLTVPGGPLRRVRALLGQWRWFAAPVVLSAAYLVAYLSLTSGSRVAVASADRSAGFFEAVDNSVLRLFLPGLLGGPWTATGAITTLNATPSNIALAVSGVVWVLIVGCSFMRRGRRAWPAWIWLLVLVAGALTMVAAFRGFGGLAVRDSRYLADLVPAAAIAVAWAYLPLRLGRAGSADGQVDGQADDAAQSAATATDRRVPAWRAPVVLATIAALVASSWVSVDTMTGRLANRYSRNYVNGMRNAVRIDPSAPLLVTPAPSVAVMFGTTRDVADAMGIKAHWVASGADLQMVDPIGRVRLVTVPGHAWKRTGERPDCGWAVTADSPITVRIPKLESGAVRIGLMSGQARQVTAEIAGAPGASTTMTVDGLADAVLAGAWVDGLTVRVEGEGTVCLTDVAAGVPTPAAGPSQETPEQ